MTGPVRRPAGTSEPRTDDGQSTAERSSPPAGDGAHGPGATKGAEGAKKRTRKRRAPFVL